jgi:2-succinyl-6-hydroxy-2,4-cyclohexadiene-1-carboxylate synthase
MEVSVVLLHGFTNTGASWAPVIAQLPESYRALAPDLRGHGGAAAAQPVSLEAVIGDVAALAPERFTLAGYSMGGRIALHAALALPRRVQRLVLISASPGLAGAHERRERRQADERLADELERSTLEQFAQRWAQNPCSPTRRLRWSSEPMPTACATPPPAWLARCGGSERPCCRRCGNACPS